MKSKNIDILKQKLFRKINEVEEHKVEELDSTDENVLLNKCDEFNNKIYNIEKRTKHYYYYFGFFFNKGLQIFIS